MIALGVDPGNHTGWAIVSDDGLVTSRSAPRDTACHELMRTCLRLRGAGSPLDAVAVEAPFVGGKQSMSSAGLGYENFGFVWGCLFGSGLMLSVDSSPMRYRPRASEWRKDYGWNKRSLDPKQEAISFATAHLGRRPASDHQAEAIAIAFWVFERALSVLGQSR